MYNKYILIKGSNEHKRPESGVLGGFSIRVSPEWILLARIIVKTAGSFLVSSEERGRKTLGKTDTVET